MLKAQALALKILTLTLNLETLASLKLELSPSCPIWGLVRSGRIADICHKWQIIHKKRAKFTALIITKIWNCNCSDLLIENTRCNIPKPWNSIPCYKYTKCDLLCCFVANNSLENLQTCLRKIRTSKCVEITNVKYQVWSGGITHCAWSTSSAPSWSARPGGGGRIQWASWSRRSRSLLRTP